MKFWVFESNLMWSSRLLQSLRGLGHEASVRSLVPEDELADGAIINLGDPKAQFLVPDLKQLGVFVIAHAGHKEKELLELGKDLEVDRLAANSELTYKLPQILEELRKPHSTQS
jgi:hypothetical protein